MMMKAGLTLVVLAGMGFAQDAAAPPPKAPADVDDALRMRVTQFYQLQIEGRYADMMGFVAEDSRNAFLGASRRRYRSCQISDIQYQENFQKARVLAVCDTDYMMPMAGPVQMNMPRTTYWKRVDGEWYWYVDPKRRGTTPFGPRANAPKSGGPRRSSGVPAAPTAPASLGDIMKAVTANKTAVRLSGGPQTVKVTNTLPGDVTVEVQGPLPEGLKVTPAKVEMEAGQTAEFSFRLESGTLPAARVTVNLLVASTGAVIPINVSQ